MAGEVADERAARTQRSTASLLAQVNAQIASTALLLADTPTSTRPCWCGAPPSPSATAFPRASPASCLAWTPSR